MDKPVNPKRRLRRMYKTVVAFGEYMNESMEGLTGQAYKRVEDSAGENIK